MAEALERMADALYTTFITVWGVLGRPTWNPTTWNLWVWASVAIVASLLVLLLVRSVRKREHTATHPELLISKGAIVQLENSILQKLRVKFSNLGAYPVQLLEITLNTEHMPEPIMIEAIELLPPFEAVDLEAVLPTDVVGETGTLSAYAYVARRGTRIYRLRATFTWEPWNKRYKVSTLGQQLKPARGLSSTEVDEMRRRAWAEHNPRDDATQPRPTPDRPRPARQDSEEDENRAPPERNQKALRFGFSYEVLGEA